MRRVLLAILLACSAVAQAGDPTLPPTRLRALERWLDAGDWRETWLPEAAPHGSLGPHGTVRTWYSPALVEDLAAGRTVFRPGAAMVKELFDRAGTARQGFSVMRKVRAKSGVAGRGWFFYEKAGAAAYRGRGLAVCTGCHRRGTDYLLSTFRP